MLTRRGPWGGDAQQQRRTRVAHMCLASESAGKLLLTRRGCSSLASWSFCHASVIWRRVAAIKHLRQAHRGRRERAAGWQPRSASVALLQGGG